MGKNKKKKSTIFIILMIVFSLGILYCGSNYDEISIKLDNLLYALEEKYSDNNTDYSGDEEIRDGYDSDDVGGTLEEQEEYATQDRLYTIDELNQKIRNHLVSQMNMGSHGRIDIGYSSNEYGEPSIVTVKLYMADIKSMSKEEKEILEAEITAEIGEEITIIHDQILNTYIHYGYDLDSVDFQVTNTFGIVITETKGYLMGYSNEYYDFG